MVLRGLSLLLLLTIGGCATAGYERHGVFDSKHDKIYQHRARFIDGGRVSMAYSIVYWEAIEGKVEKAEKIPEVYYIWLRNNIDSSLQIDPKNLSLLTEKGERIHLSPLTDRTTLPLKKTELAGHELTEGYVVFEVSRESIDKDKPSRIIYEDEAGNRAVRYIQVDDMKSNEGLILEERVKYYAPVYPRNYWYPHYYPYAYYPYDMSLYFFYHYKPHRRHYYYDPPRHEKKRRFHTPSEPKERHFWKEPAPRKKREFR